MNELAADDRPSQNYLEAVNRAIDHVVSNLAAPVRLAEVARVAQFSPFHFHRVFQSLVGETLNEFVLRVRLERALSIMAHDPSRSLTDVGAACGFSSSSEFSRSFKRRYGVPPSAFDLEGWRAKKRTALAEAAESAEGTFRLDQLPPGENPDGFEVRIRDLPARTVAYMRVADPYRPNAVTDAARDLVEWAEERGLAGGQWLGYMWDDPTVVDMALCRYDVAVVIDDAEVGDGEVGGRVGRFEFPPMRVAEVEVRGTIDLEQRALDWIYGTWLPASRYVPDDQPGFEAWIGRPFAHGIEHFELLAQVPIKPR